MKAVSRSRFYYGWVIVASAFVILSLAYIVRYTFTVFFVAIIEEFGWSRASTALVFSVAGVVYGLTGPLCGMLADRFGPRWVVGSGAVVLAAGLAASSRLSELWHYYLFFGVVAAVGTNLTGFVPNATLLTNWFVRRLGLMLGIASAGIGFGILIGAPLAQYLIFLAGWRNTYLVLAAAVLVVMLPTALLQRRRPQDMGLQPDGGAPAVKERRVDPEQLIVDRVWAGRVWTLGRAAGTLRFWLVLMSSALLNFAAQMVMVHQVALLVDAGYGKMVAATAVGMLGVASMVGKLTWGAASDRLGREIVFSVGMLFGIVGIALLALTRNVVSPWLAYAGGIWVGLGYAVAAPMMPTVTSDLFRGKSFGAIFGVFTLAANLGAAIGAWVAGYIFDLSGDYLLALGLAGTGFAIAIVTLLWAAPSKVRLVPGKAARRLGFRAAD